MKPTVYVETSVVSYLTAQPSRDIVTAARQQITRDWWQMKRLEFDLYVSEFVVREARAGDPQAAARRLEALQGIPEISLTEDAAQLAEMLVRNGPLPE